VTLYILGLTGSIAMGKTWGAACFRSLGVPVHDADACVHALLAPGGGAAARVLAAFPGARAPDGGVDRIRLGAEVFGDEAKLETLEAMLHPLVRASQRAFLARHARSGRGLVVLDIPLLYEAGARARVDAVAVVSAPAYLQRQRALRRPGMSAEKLEAILARQMPDDIKRRVSEFVVATAGTRGQSLRQIAAIVKVARGRKGRAWGPDWGN